MGAIQRVAGTLPLAFDPDYSPARGFLGPRWVTFGRSRVRESRTLGSVGAKAEWLSYPTTTLRGFEPLTPRLPVFLGGIERVLARVVANGKARAYAVVYAARRVIRRELELHCREALLGHRLGTIWAPVMLRGALHSLPSRQRR